ncbi:DoxX family protein [Sinomicrobium sp. M5D2P9]
MENLRNNSAEILILLLLIITFVQSGLDKITDWKGNISWLREHFAKTFLENLIPFSMAVILVLETIAGILCIWGVVNILADNDKTYGFYGAALCCFTLLLLLFGQRVAKDYDGARGIVIYLIPAIFGVYLLQ